MADPFGESTDRRVRSDVQIGSVYVASESSDVGQLCSVNTSVAQQLGTGNADLKLAIRCSRRQNGGGTFSLSSAACCRLRGMGNGSSVLCHGRCRRDPGEGHAVGLKLVLARVLHGGLETRLSCVFGLSGRDHSHGACILSPIVSNRRRALANGFPGNCRIRCASDLDGGDHDRAVTRKISFGLGCASGA